MTDLGTTTTNVPAAGVMLREDNEHAQSICHSSTLKQDYFFPAASLHLLSLSLSPLKPIPSSP